MKRIKPIRFPDAKFYAESFGKKMFKNNHYFKSLLEPENRWCVLAQFEIFEQIWGKGLLEKTWKLQMFCFSFVYLLLHVTHMQDFKKQIFACKAAAGAKLG